MTLDPPVTPVRDSSCKSYVALLGTAVADVAVAPFETRHRYVSRGSWDVCAQYRNIWASSFLGHDGSHYLWLCNSQA